MSSFELRALSSPHLPGTLAESLWMKDELLLPQPHWEVLDARKKLDRLRAGLIACGVDEALFDKVGLAFSCATVKLLFFFLLCAVSTH